MFLFRYSQSLIFVLYYIYTLVPYLVTCPALSDFVNELSIHILVVTSVVFELARVEDVEVFMLRIIGSFLYNPKYLNVSSSDQTV